MGSLWTTWRNRLEHAAASRLPQHPWPQVLSDIPAWIRHFRDDAGHRRPVDGAFLAHVCRIPLLQATPSDWPDVILWEHVTAGESDSAGIQRVLDAMPPALAMTRRDFGMEIWAETELSSLHALSWLGEHHWHRATAAAEFMMAELQPDNGTNHPWAIHWFAMLEATTSNRYAGMYAETLLLNAMSNGGTPDLFSALILADGARWLAEHESRFRHHTA